MMNSNLQKPVRGRLGALITLGAVAACCLGTSAIAVEEAVQPYPLDICIVSGDELDGSESTVVVVLGIREIRFCDAECSAAFEADTDGYLRQLDTAIMEAQLPGYPLDTCLQSGQPLGEMGEPYDHVYGNRLVRLCCAGCLKGFEENAAALLAVLDQAIAERGAADPVKD